MKSLFPYLEAELPPVPEKVEWYQIFFSLGRIGQDLQTQLVQQASEAVKKYGIKNIKYTQSRGGTSLLLFKTIPSIAEQIKSKIYKSKNSVHIDMTKLDVDINGDHIDWLDPKDPHWFSETELPPAPQRMQRYYIMIGPDILGIKKILKNCGASDIKTVHDLSAPIAELWFDIPIINLTKLGNALRHIWTTRRIITIWDNNNKPVGI